MLAAANLFLWARRMVTTGIHTDFPSYLTFAYLGMHSGWSHLYDWELTRTIAPLFGAAYWPNQYPPFTFLLFVPFLYLPYPIAYFLFLALMVTALGATWWMLAPPADRRLHLLVLAAFLPVGFCLWLGQIIPLVALCVALAYRLLELRRPREDLLAGIVLAGLVLKPNLALLVPVALLAAGRWRALTGLAVAGVVLAVTAYFLLTPYGITQYYLHLRSVTADQPRVLIDSGLTMVGLFGLGPLLLVADAAVVAAVALVAVRTRANGAAAGLAAALAGSLLVTTYLHWQDLVMVLPATWLWLRAAPARRHTVPFLVAVWAVANFTLAVPVVLLAWLAVMTAETVLAPRSEPAPAKLDVSAGNAGV